MNNYIIVKKDMYAYEAFNCENEKEAIFKYFDFLINDSELRNIFYKACKNLSISESLKLFYETFHWEVNEDDKILAIYLVQGSDNF